MRLAKTMNAEQFAELLFNMKVNETVDFGLERSWYFDDNHKIDEEHPLETWDVSNWYFAKRMDVPMYDSELILVDYVGGGQAYAMPLGEDWGELDMVSDVERMFEHLESMNGFEVNEVYVDMGESEE